MSPIHPLRPLLETLSYVRLCIAMTPSGMNHACLRPPLSMRREGEFVASPILLQNRLDLSWKYARDPAKDQRIVGDR